MSGLGKVSPGDPLVIAADTHNAFVDAALDYRRRQNSPQQSRPSVAGSDVVLIRNDSGADRSRFELVGLGAPIFTPAAALETFKSSITFTGQALSAGSAGKFAILLDPIPQGKLGRACVHGVCQVQVNVTDASHQYAEAQAGQPTRLASAASGSAQILWQASTSGLTWALVRLIGPSAAAGNPKVLASTGATANTDTWDITNQGSYSGVRWKAFRLYWSGTEGQPILAFVREATYAADGRLVAVSAETQSTAFGTGPCEEP